MEHDPNDLEKLADEIVRESRSRFAKPRAKRRKRKPPDASVLDQAIARNRKARPR